MLSKLVFKAKDVAGFSLGGAEDSWESRLLIDKGGVGSNSLVMNHFTLKPGRSTGDAGSHPEPFEEVYYVLSGAGVVYLGDPAEEFNLEPGIVVFIPAGTDHRVVNTGGEDLELLTIMPAELGALPEGANPVYDGRRRAWGKTFKLAAES